MIEHWERTMVVGQGPEGREASETVVHRRGEDVLGMAMRRNPEMAGCSRFEMRTVEAFTRIRDRTTRHTYRKVPEHNMSQDWPLYSNPFR